MSSRMLIVLIVVLLIAGVNLGTHVSTIALIVDKREQTVKEVIELVSISVLTVIVLVGLIRYVRDNTSVR